MDEVIGTFIFEHGGYRVNVISPEGKYYTCQLSDVKSGNFYFPVVSFHGLGLNDDATKVSMIRFKEDGTPYFYSFVISNKVSYIDGKLMVCDGKKILYPLTYHCSFIGYNEYEIENINTHLLLESV